MVHVHFKKKVMPPGCSNLYKLHIFFQTHTAPVSFQLLHDWHLLHGHLMRCPGPKPRTQAPCGALPWDEKVVAITQDAFLPCPTSPMEIWWIFSLEGFKKTAKKKTKIWNVHRKKKRKIHIGDVIFLSICAKIREMVSHDFWISDNFMTLASPIAPGSTGPNIIFWLAQRDLEAENPHWPSSQKPIIWKQQVCVCGSQVTATSESLIFLLHSY